MTRAQTVVDERDEVAVESTGARGGAAARRPGLDVGLTVRRASRADDGALVRVRVAGANAPFRVYVYADGELVEAWIPGSESNEFVCRALAAGRHTVTARAIDALGRWGGASVMFGAPAIMQPRPRSAATSRDRGVGCTVAAVDSA